MTMTFGERLGMLLKEKGMTQGELMRKTYISQPVISNYVTGKREPSAYTLSLMANALGVTMDYLYRGRK